MRAALGAVALGLTVCGTSAGAHPRIVPAFRSALPGLRTTRVPLLLPTQFDGAIASGMHLYVKPSAGRHFYAIEIDFSRDCDGANVCSAGSFAAYDSVYRRAHSGQLDPEISWVSRKPTADDLEEIRADHEVLDRRVRLMHGLHGFYSEYLSGAADGGNSYLRWYDRGVVYTIATRISSQKSLVAIANSAIANGPL